MADYPFLDPLVRYYGRLSRMTACATFLQTTAATGIRSVNARWRTGRSAGYGGNVEGHTIRWVLRNYPSLPVSNWMELGENIPEAPTLLTQVTLGICGGYGIDQSAPHIDFPPTYSNETGNLEPTGSRYAIVLHAEMYYIGASGERKTLSRGALSLTTPVSVGSILTDVGVALINAERSFCDEMSSRGMEYSDPVYEPPETVRIIGRDYNDLLRNQADNESARAIGEEFRIWCQVHKGVGTIEEGLRRCSTTELANWLARIESMGWYLQRKLGDDLSRRVLAYEAAEAAAKEAALLPIAHIDPWGGDANGGR